MHISPKGWQHWLVLGLFVFTLTACSTPGTRESLEIPIDRSGQWNDSDSRVTAEALIKDALDRPWSQRFTQVMGRTPVVMVGTVLNRTHESLNTPLFVQDLERALGRSRQVQFVAKAGQRQEDRQEQSDREPRVLGDPVKPPGQAAGADFIFQGTIQSLMDERDGTRAVFYQVDLELLDVASNVKVWQGQKKVKKLVERSKTTL